MAIFEKTYKVRITLDTPMLGAVPLNEEVFSDFHLDKSIKAAEKFDAKHGGNGNTVTIAEVEAEFHAPDPEGLKQRSGFYRDDAGRPLLSNHVIKGFLKEAARARSKQGGITKTTPAYIQLINLHLFTKPRMILINTVHADKVSAFCERPLRADTALGPRVALKASEQNGAGATLDFELTTLLPNIVTEELLHEWFSYGQYHGLGEWRNNENFGQFSYTLTAK